MNICVLLLFVLVVLNNNLVTDRSSISKEVCTNNTDKVSDGFFIPA
jgi:hypothetical protein